MSPEFLTGFLNSILTQYGAFVSGLLVVVWWLSKQLSDERKAHAATIERVFGMQEKQSEAANATAQALSLLRAAHERRE